MENKSTVLLRRMAHSNYTKVFTSPSTELSTQFTNRIWFGKKSPKNENDYMVEHVLKIF